MQLIFETDYKTRGKGFSLTLHYEALKKIKNANLRDLLITRFFSDAAQHGRYINNSTGRDSCLMDALAFIKEPALRDVLNYERKFARGVRMKNFSFADTSGNKIGLKDLKGKVFLIDFYFEGCAGCSSFAKNFEQNIYPEFQHNPNFEVLSVNTDLTRKAWLRAIQSGAYTQAASINLSTGPKGFNHPLFKHYGITAFPWVLLVNKTGNVEGFNLYGTSSADISRMITEALKEEIK